MKSFIGYTPYKTTPWQDTFDTYYNDDGSLVLVSKEIFISEEDDGIPAFKYHYVINAFDSYVYGSSDHYIAIELWMVIALADPESIDSLEQCGVRLGYETVDYDTENIPSGWYDYYYNVLDNQEVIEYIDVAASVLPSVDSTRGFYLDRPMNQIGTTGWDLLRQVTTGSDAIHDTIQRILG